MKNQSLHILLLLTALLCCQSLAAQELSVKSLEYVPNDAAAASYETQMQDINGNFAGVVKVYIALDGVQFEGGGVLKQEKRGMGEYWLWMAQGSNRLKVRAPGFLPLEVNFRAYEEVKIVKPKLTYKLVITVPKAEDVQKQKFTLRYTPADATVIIDDQVVEGKNGVYEDELLVGDHSYSIIKRGYAVDKGTFSLLSSAPKRLIVELEKLQEAAPVAQSAPTTLSPVQTTTSPSARQEATVEDAEIAGKTPAQIRDLGKDYRNGTGGKAQDYAKALKYFRVAVERGNTDAMNEIGYMYNTGSGVARNYSEAIKWFRKAAEQGDAQGQTMLGNMYENGKGVAQDYAEAVKWYRKAAEQGNDQGQEHLGDMYLDGHGVPKDYSEAIQWFRKSAEQGNAWSQSSLGYMYSQGYGVTKDDVEAVKWYRKSAEQGNVAAQYNLAQRYRYGGGVDIDLTQAKYWYEKAAAQGSEFAKKQLKGLDGNVSGNLSPTLMTANEQTVVNDTLKESERVTLGMFPQHFTFFWFIMHPGGYMPNTKVSLEEFKQRANSPYNGHNMYSQLKISERYPHMVDVKFNPSHNSNQIISDKYVFMPDSINSTVSFEEDKKDRIRSVFYTIYLQDASRAKELVSKWNAELKKYARKVDKDDYKYSWGKYADHSFQSVYILAPFYVKTKKGEHLVLFHVDYEE